MSGAVGAVRCAALLLIATDGGPDERKVAFMSAVEYRESGSCLRPVKHLAWSIFAWLGSESDNILGMYGGDPVGPGRLA